MKKIMTLLFVMLGTFVLSACDAFETGISDLWFDENMSEIHVSYRIERPQSDDETGETPVEILYMMAKTKDTDWVILHELDSYSADDLVIPYTLGEYGDIELKIIKVDETGAETFSTGVINLYVNEPQYVYHFDAQFDSWNGIIFFNFGINEQVVDKIVIYKSMDGGNTWEAIIDTALEFEDEFGYKNHLEYYELEENSYVYKMEAYSGDEFLQEFSAWGEINVFYNDRNFEGDPKVDYVSAHYDAMTKNVNLWWNSFGAFDEVRIEKSTDGETWEEVAVLPRIAQGHNYIEEVDGEYLYRVTALVGEEAVSSVVTETHLRVKEGALIGYLNVWYNWDNSSNQVDWDFYSDEVEEVIVERKDQNEEFEVLGSFGSLKKTHTDENVDPGTYTYIITLKDTEGNILDSLESKEITIEQPQEVYHLNAWFNQSTGKVQFHFGFNHNKVTHYQIEKSNDGGLNWVSVVVNDVELNEDGWYVDNVSEYELEEGVYAYRITGFNDQNQILGEAYNYHEVVVDYNNLNFDEPTSIHYLDGDFNIYDKAVHLWWGTQGTYNEHLIEYSLDNETFTELLRLPRVATFTSIDSLDEGEYYFRISAVDDEGNIVVTFTSENKISVRENAQIGKVHVWYDCWTNKVEVNWDIIQDNVAYIQVLRTNADTSEITLVDTYGPLKTTLLDEFTSDGTYFYTVVLLDENENMIDELSSNVIEYYTCE